MASLLNQDFASESEDDDFNPAPAEESDNEGDSDGVGSDKSQPNSSKTKSSKKRSDSQSPTARQMNGKTRDDLGEEQDDNGTRPRIDGDGDDEEDDDDDEEDEDEAISGRPRKRARRDPRNQYLDVEAEVDEDEGDEEDEEEQQDGFIADTHPDDLADLPDGTETDDRRHRELDRQRERANQMDAERQAELLREKYGRRQNATADAVHVPRRLLLPSVDDPSVFAIRCKPGKEREVVYAITKRMIERQKTRNPMPIMSAFERSSTPMSSFIYVEARRQADILESLDGILNLFPRSKILLVPIKEMPDLLRVQKTEALLPGGYVRIRKGRYQLDLAQIDEVETNGLEVSLRIVPRLDYGQNEDTGGPMLDPAKRKRAGANAVARPPPRLFSEVEAKKKHGRFMEQVSMLDKKHFRYMGENFVNGFLLKDFKINQIITHDVNPTLEEVTRFATGADDGTENLDLTALAATLKKNTTNEGYLPGDVVEVYEGEQSGVSGKAVAVRGDVVTVAVSLPEELRGQSIEVPISQLRKAFRLGDHVKVLSGSHRDEVGLVTSIEKDTVTLAKDLGLGQITVFSKDLREASDSGVAGGLGRYDIHDLVQLDPATVGCVVKVDRESMRVLDQNGSLRSVLPSQISNKLERRKQAVAVDKNGSEIRNDDTVREIGGEAKQGVIIHIHRSFLFVHNREQTEHSGIWTTRSANVTTVAAKGGRIAQGKSTGPDLTKMNPAMMRNGANGASMAPPKSFGRDRSLGQTVTIRKGAYKGLLGIVKDTTDTEARVELHTKGKTITVPKDTLGFKNPLTGARIDYTSFLGSRGGRGGAPGRGDHGGTTPRQPDWSGTGSRTPLPMASSSRTPAWSGAVSSRTPAWQSGSRTPAYGGNDGSRTVNPYNDGSRTAYGGSGRTPAWNPTATTSSYTQDPFTNAASSRTPAWSGSGAANAPTPSAYPYDKATPSGSSSRAYDAPTPAMDFASAPTPSASASATAGGGGGGGVGAVGITGGAGGVYSAPTPSASGGAAGGAPTPQFSGDAPTPFGGLPETPGFGGGGDDGDAGGPRYEEGTPSP